MPLDIKHLQTWTGRSERRDDQVTGMPVKALAATLDIDPIGMPACEADVLPLLWHWLYFLPLSPLSEAGQDGHPRRGGFLPPVPLPRRMWAGSSFTFHRPLRVGEVVTRVSTINSLQFKEGRQGPLVFVRVRHEISHPFGLAITEDQDIVYREAAPSGVATAPSVAAPRDPLWERTISPDSVLLFRYSALTFNSHLIHYDRDYARDVEGYPGLVVHGPLVATLLMDLLRREVPLARVASFSFRAVSPLFDVSDFRVCGKPSEDGRSVHLWVNNAAGALAMTAIATLEDPFVL